MAAHKILHKFTESLRVENTGMRCNTDAMPSYNELEGCLNTYIVPTDDRPRFYCKEWGKNCRSEVQWGWRTECAGVLHGTHMKNEERVAVVL
jgi:hypothetical protein